MRIKISAIALALVSLLWARPAHALFGAVGWIGYGNVFQDGEDVALGPTLELGGYLSIAIVALDLTYWTDLDEGGDSSQLRLGGRAKIPVIPIYGRLAFGLPLDGDVQDAQGADMILGAGFESDVVPLFKLSFEVDYHVWTASEFTGDPLEAKVGVIFGF